MNDGDSPHWVLTIIMLSKYDSTVHSELETISYEQFLQELRSLNKGNSYYIFDFSDKEQDQQSRDQAEIEVFHWQNGSERRRELLSADGSLAA